MLLSLIIYNFYLFIFQHDNEHYIGIIGHHYNGVPAMFIVLGVLVCLIGFLGTIGGIFVQLLCGRIVLRIVSYKEREKEAESEKEIRG